MHIFTPKTVTGIFDRSQQKNNRGKLSKWF